LSPSPNKVFKIYFHNQASWPKEWRELAVQVSAGLFTNKELLKHGIRPLAEELVIEQVEREIEYGPERTSQDANGSWYIVQAPTGAYREIITFIRPDTGTKHPARTRWTMP
jgi:hypothetical protein